jgi:hypothetical protein
LFTPAPPDTAPLNTVPLNTVPLNTVPFTRLVCHVLYRKINQLTSEKLQSDIATYSIKN